MCKRSRMFSHRRGGMKKLYKLGRIVHGVSLLQQLGTINIAVHGHNNQFHAHNRLKIGSAISCQKQTDISIEKFLFCRNSTKKKMLLRYRFHFQIFVPWEMHRCTLVLTTVSPCGFPLSWACCPRTLILVKVCNRFASMEVVVHALGRLHTTINQTHVSRKQLVGLSSLVFRRLNHLRYQ